MQYLRYNYTGEKNQQHCLSATHMELSALYFQFPKFNNSNVYTLAIVQVVYEG